MLIRRRDADSPLLSPRALGRFLPRVLPAVTEYLALALAAGTQAEPSWNDVEWRIARAVAVIHGISPLLSTRLAWAGPPGWRTFLESQRTHTASRYLRMTALLAKIDELAVQQKIAFLPLKGEALHAIGLYAAGERPMADIDLLVKGGQLGAMSQAISLLGYRLVSSTPSEQGLVPIDRPAASYLGEHADQGITIELHSRIHWPMPVRVVDITAQLWPATPRSGRNDYPSLGALMAHLLMHAAVNMQLRILRMLQLHDIALLARRMSVSDWNEVLEPSVGCGPSWWSLPPLQLTEHYYPGAIPVPTIESARVGCPALLRFLTPGWRISEVSASNLRRSLFPALTWAGSVPEAANCVGNRLMRGMQALRGSPRIPATTELQPWITPSHRWRLLEVVLGRSRPESLSVIRAALDSDLPASPSQARPKAA